MRGSTPISSSASEPTAAEVETVIARYLDDTPATVERFQTGLARFVFDVVTANGRRVVVRFARREDAATVAHAAAWNERLRALDIPLPRLIASETSDETAGFPFLLLEQLPGRDLGDVYQSLTGAQKRTLAGQIAAIQQRVATLPPGQGFGFAVAPDDPALLPTWRAVLDQSLNRAHDWITSVGVVSPTVVERVHDRFPALAPDLDRIAPLPFLDDTTTKNVIISEGRLSGIVDVDLVCYGDPLSTVALTRMSLLARGDDTDYIDAWLAALPSAPDVRRRLTLYTAIFCVTFLGELGQRFNAPVAPPVDPADVAHLRAILDDLLADLDAEIASGSPAPVETRDGVRG